MTYKEFKESLIKIFVGKFLVWGELYLGKCLEIEENIDEKDFSLLCQRASAINPWKVSVDSSWGKHEEDITHVLRPFDTESLAYLYKSIRED